MLAMQVLERLPVRVHMETTIVYWGYMGIMEKKMEATIAYWGYICCIKLMGLEVRFEHS